MNEEEKVIWLSEMSIDVEQLLIDYPEDYNREWADQLMHVAEHVATASVDELRETVMMLSAQPGDGPARGHMAIVGAGILIAQKNEGN